MGFFDYLIAWFTALPGYLNDDMISAAGWVNTHLGAFGCACVLGVVAVVAGSLRLTSARRSGRNGG